MNMLLPRLAKTTRPCKGRKVQELFNAISLVVYTLADDLGIEKVHGSFVMPSVDIDETLVDAFRTGDKDTFNDVLNVLADAKTVDLTSKQELTELMNTLNVINETLMAALR